MSDFEVSADLNKFPPPFPKDLSWEQHGAAGSSREQQRETGRIKLMAVVLQNENIK
jgi:hypothetical protein